MSADDAEIAYNGIRIPTRQAVRRSYERAQQESGDKKNDAEETSTPDKE